MPSGIYQRTSEHRRKISLALTGEKNPFYGKTHTHEVRKRIQLARLQKYSENSNAWKGDKAGNRAIHEWIRNNFLPPKECQFCGLIKPLDLANMTGVYNREFKNWKYICRKCHVYHDGTIYNLRHFTRRNNYQVAD